MTRSPTSSSAEQGLDRKLIGMAAHFQGTFGLTPDHFSGYYCAMNNGCMELTQEFLDGAILYKQPTRGTTSRRTRSSTSSPTSSTSRRSPTPASSASSLRNCNIEEPDVICLQLPTQAAFHLLACYASRPTGRSLSSRSAASPTAPTRGCAP
ncbi:MAG: hypothetical protein ACLUNO_01520 [Oscillospiraceae bacterium]